MNDEFALSNPLLEAVVAVAQHKSVHAAARAIFISQTALTQRIQTLEERLGITLFIRTRNGMTLTAEGEHILRYCQTMLAYSRETLTAINQAGKISTTSVRLSGPSSIMISRIIPACAQLMHDYPKLMIHFDIDDTNKVLHSLIVGDSQFALLTPAQLSKEMQIKKLQCEEYLLVCSSTWRQKSLRNIIENHRIIDFDQSDSTTLNYLMHYHLFEDTKPERLFVNRNESLAKLLIEGYGYGVLTKEFAKPYLDKKELIVLNDGKAYQNTLYLAWFDRPEPPEYFSELIKRLC